MTRRQKELDTEPKVLESIRFFFDTFRGTGSAGVVVKAFRQERLLFPQQLKKGPTKAIWCGQNFRAAGRHAFCTTLVMPVRSCTGGVALVSTRKEALPTRSCPASSGCYRRAPTPVKSPGNSTKKTWYRSVIRLSQRPQTTMPCDRAGAPILLAEPGPQAFKTPPLRQQRCARPAGGAA